MKRKTLALAGTLTILAVSANSFGFHAVRGTAAPQHSLSGTLTIFDWSNLGGTAPSVAKNAVAAYEKMHPGVTIKTVPLASGDPTVYEESNLAAGRAQDIVSPTYTMQVFNDLSKNVWLDLSPYLQTPDPYVKGNKHWIDIYDPAIDGQNVFVGGKHYVVSWSAQDATFFYNKDIFAKAGITHTPTTWAELMADSDKIKKAGYIPDQYFLDDTYPIGENGSFVSLLENQVMSKTLQKLDTNHNGVVDVQELVYGIKHKIFSPMNADYQEAWKLYKQWSQYWEPGAASAKGPYLTSNAAVAPFLSGKVAMTYNAEWLIGYITASKSKINWGVFTMPQVTRASSTFATPGQKGVGIWGAWNAIAWGIPVSTKSNGHLDLALDFLKYITAPQNDVPVTLANGNLPTTRGFTPTDPITKTFVNLIKHPTMQFAAEASLGPTWLRNRINTQQAYISGLESLSQAMSDMQRYTDQAADQAIKTYKLTVS
jgi:ABC-type glycerol-3-phosphate transport system substrate-binding protein